MKAAVVGAGGYAGGELIRLLLQHPEVNHLQATSRRMAGKPVGLAHPNLRGWTNLSFVHPDELKDCDCLFLSPSQRNIHAEHGPLGETVAKDSGPGSGFQA